MAQHLEYGSWAEEAAQAYLLKAGYAVLHRNYRYKRAEVDLIACKDKTLVFVEVKARGSSRYEWPEAAVTERKQALLLLAAQHYLEEVNWPGELRFDIMAITGRPSHYDIHHIEDAFH